jgi:hypothetical protein
VLKNPSAECRRVAIATAILVGGIACDSPRAPAGCAWLSNNGPLSIALICRETLDGIVYYHDYSTGILRDSATRYLYVRDGNGGWLTWTTKGWEPYRARTPLPARNEYSAESAYQAIRSQPTSPIISPYHPKDCGGADYMDWDCYVQRDNRAIVTRHRRPAF